MACGFNGPCVGLVHRDGGRRKTATLRSSTAPPRRRVLTERAPGWVPAARSHTPNHYKGLWDRVAGTKEELKMEAAGRGEFVIVHC